MLFLNDFAVREECVDILREIAIPKFQWRKSVMLTRADSMTDKNFRLHQGWSVSLSTL